MRRRPRNRKLQGTAGLFLQHGKSDQRDSGLLSTELVVCNRRGRDGQRKPGAVYKEPCRRALKVPGRIPLIRQAGRKRQAVYNLGK